MQGHTPRVVLTLVGVLSCRAEARPAPPKTISTPPQRAPAPSPADASWPWPGPHCFAYAPRLSSYACTSLYAYPSPDSEQDLASESIFTTLEHVRGTRANLHLGVALVSAFGSRDVTVESRPPPLTPNATISEVRALLDDAGFVDPVPHRAVLEPDAWVPVEDVKLRYGIDVHEGDASYEIRGTLELRCTPDGPAHAVDLDPDDGIGGPFAVASAAENTGLVAITIEHQDGGEGYTDVTWRSYVLDTARWCGG